ncbi:MAG: response regulator [Deltaproteobacteria bacterium]|nr:response regulator [Deltaproteobacteria bacterium]
MPLRESNNLPLIMVTDDSEVNLLVVKAALQESCKVLTAGSAELMLEALEWAKPDLILLDVSMPGMSGFEALGVLKARPETRDIPVIFLTVMNDDASELKGLELGAVDYIAKPFSPPLLRKRVELNLLLQKQKSELHHFNDNLLSLVEEKTRTISKLQNKLLESMADIIEGRDGVTGAHNAKMRQFLRILLTAVVKSGLWPEETSAWDIELLCQSCQLHDIGKIAVSDDILKKPGKLTAEEFAVIRRHTVRGVAFIEKMEDGEAGSDFLRYAKIFAGYHHERWDGTGYPYGLSGESIPLLGRLMAIVDVYEALTAERPYKKPFGHDDAVRIVIDGKGTHFDPALVGLFEENAEMFRKVEHDQ